MASEIIAVNQAIGLTNEKKYVDAWELIKDIPDDSPIWTKPGPASIKGVLLWKHCRDPDNALLMFNKILEAEPDDAAAAQNRDFIMIELKVKEFQRAQDLQKDNRLQQAADVYCEIDLDDPITNEIRFFIANNYGNCLVQLGKNYEALQAFETAIEMNPQCMEAHYNRAVIMKADENYVEALHSFEQALLVNPTFPQVVLGKLDAMCNLWQIEELHAYAEQLIDEDVLENDYHPYFYRGFAKCEMEEYTDAISDLELALSIGGVVGEEYRKIQISAAKAYAKYGEFNLMEGDPDGAIEYFDGAMKYAPGNAAQRVILYNKALALIQLDRIPDAIKELLDTIRKYPDHMPAREALAQLYLMLDDLVPAIKQLEVVLEDPELEQADLMYNLGVAYFKKDRIADARDTFLRVLNMDPEHERAIEALAAMDKLLAMKKYGHADANRTKGRNFVPGTFDGERDGFTWKENGLNGAGYYKDYIAGDDEGEMAGYVHIPKGPLGKGYYRLGDDRPYYIAGEDTGAKPGYTYKQDGHLGAGYYLKDTELPACARGFSIKRTGQDMLIKRDQDFDDDPEKARLQRLGWSDDLIQRSLKVTQMRNDEVFEGGGSASVAHYVPSTGRKGAPASAENSTPGTVVAATVGSAALAAAEEEAAAPAEPPASKYADPSTLDCPYESLKEAPFPEGVNPAEREMYLSDAEFEQVTGYTKEEWAEVPKWKKQNVKRKHGLF